MPQFIEGIYNYCDRWCEKCSKTAHCRLFAEESKRDWPESEEPDEDKFYNQLEETFEKTLDLLDEFVRKNGISLDEMDLKQEEEKLEKLEMEVQEHPLMALAEAYTNATWVLMKDANFWVFDRKSTGEVAHPSDFTLEGQEVVSWYHVQIQSKIGRALFSLLQEDPFMEEANGSAKVALIAVDRSIAAWGVLLAECPGYDQAIMERVLELERIKRGILQVFTDAPSFKRPGFDR